MLALDKIILCEFVMLMSKVGSIESSIEILAWYCWFRNTVNKGSNVSALREEVHRRYFEGITGEHKLKADEASEPCEDQKSSAWAGSIGDLYIQAARTMRRSMTNYVWIMI